MSDHTLSGHTLPETGSATSGPVAMPLSIITCPDCGTMTELAQLGRDAGEFCATCDYPLFWAPGAARAIQGPSSSSGEALRRLPGAGGRQELGALECPTCGERQPFGTESCGRCGNPMVLPRPEPEPEPEPVVTAPPPPPPPPPAPQRHWIWWVALMVCLLVTTAAIIALA